MRRISGTDVVAAYRTTGLRPLQHAFAGGTAQQPAACGLTALVLARAPHLRTHYRALGPIDAELVLGLAPDYVLGWTAGWDTGDAAFPASPRTTEPFTLGVLDGAACWRAVTAAGLRDGSGSRAA